MAMEGHGEAKCVHCMILMCSEDEREIKTAISSLPFLEKHPRVLGGIERKRSLLSRACGRTILQFEYITNPFMPSKASEKQCEVAESFKKTSLIKNEDDEIGISCEYCHAIMKEVYIVKCFLFFLQWIYCNMF